MHPTLIQDGRAYIRCKHCRGIVDALHRQDHLKECKPYLRKQKLGRMAFEKDGKRLYAIAVQRLNPTTREWVGEMNYAHGRNPREAQGAFMASEARGPRAAETIHVVSVGLVIGMFAVDEDGKILVAD